MNARAVAVLVVGLAAVANASARDSDADAKALARLPPSALSPPLHDMKVRWDGSKVEPSGMRSFDSPRFGMTRDAGGRAHAGLDLEAAVGTPVFAVADGIIDQARNFATSGHGRLSSSSITTASSSGSSLGPVSTGGGVRSSRSR